PCAGRARCFQTSEAAQWVPASAGTYAFFGASAFREDVLGDLGGGHRRRPAGVERQMRNDLADLVLCNAVGQGAGEMAFELPLATQRDQRRDDDKAAVTLRKSGPLPDFAVDDLVGHLRQLWHRAADRFAGR